ncbi:MAG: hypothetical protein K6E72_03505 [Saccharofermentans sp.]|nr:hypothetical protein [Saccharofermentans sp.]
MEYVKGCDIIGLSKYSLKKITECRIEIAEGLRDVLSLEILSGLFEEAKTDFTDGNGKTIKGLPSGEIFVMTKKIDKKKYIIGVSCIKRIAGEPSGKKGIDSWFEGSRDKMIEDKRFFADGFEKEMAYFDHSMIDHFRNSVGFDQIGEAEYQDKIITKASGKKVLGIYFSSTALFITMIIIWGLIFKNFAIGLCFALCFVGSFTMVTNKAKSSEKDLEKAQIE